MVPAASSPPTRSATTRRSRSARTGRSTSRRFRRAFNEIVRRHEAWRTTFDTVDGEPVQVVQPPPSFDLPVLDLSHLTPSRPSAGPSDLVAEVSRVPYDLRRGPLLRPRLIRFPGEHHRLYLAMHHLVFDGVSVYRVVLPELVALYDAFSAGRAVAACRAADPVRRLRPLGAGLDHRAAGRAAPGATGASTSAPLPVLHAPARSPAAAGPSASAAAWSRCRCPARPWSACARSARQAGATLFQVLATVWALLLGRYSGAAATSSSPRRPTCASDPSSSRSSATALTPLVLRVDLAATPPFTELVVRVRNELLDGLDNLVPFERLVRDLHPGRGPRAPTRSTRRCSCWSRPMVTPGSVLVHPSDGERDRRRASATPSSTSSWSSTSAPRDTSPGG